MLAAPTVVTSVSERHLMQLYGSIPIAPADLNLPNVSQEDSVSVKLLRKFQGGVLETSSPRLVYGDGNCLYRAASLGIFGTQSYHLYLRLITSMELIARKLSSLQNAVNRVSQTSPIRHQKFV